ncbi:unnamed protein product [Peniophora sp. CBMAI 1063]|nr:unnamed protein product [Peniophora sp. CBMAI 1063]
MDLTTNIPDEMLMRIFACVQVVDPIYCVDRAYFGWLYITFVCRRWRRVAIADATLWTHWTPILCMSPWGMGTFMERSKSALISVSIRGYCPDHDAFKVLRAMKDNCIRVRAFSLLCRRTYPDISSEVMEILANVPFESLTSCHLQSLHLETVDAKGCLSLFKGRAPRLQHLVFDLPRLPFNILDWTSTIFDNLLSLDLIMLREDHRNTVTLLDTLRRMPKLSSLVIDLREESSARSSEGPGEGVVGIPLRNSDSSIVHLHRLEKLVVVSRLDDLVRLLNGITVSSSTSVALATRRPGSTSLQDEWYTALMYHLLSASRIAELSPFSAVYLSFEGGPANVNSVILKLTYEPLPYAAHGKLRTHGTRSSPEIPRKDDYDLSLQLPVSDILRILPTLSTRIEHATMMTLDKLPYNFDTRLLLPFSRVTHLRVLGAFDRPKISFLFAPEEVLLPALREIDFADVDNLDKLASCFRFGWHANYTHFWALEKLLNTRRDTHRPLSRIYLHVERDLQRLREERPSRDVIFHYSSDVSLTLPCLGLLADFAEVRIVGRDIDVFTEDA